MHDLIDDALIALVASVVPIIYFGLVAFVDVPRAFYPDFLIFEVVMSVVAVGWLTLLLRASIEVRKEIEKERMDRQ